MEARTNTSGAMATGLCAALGLLAQLRAADRNEAGGFLEEGNRGGKSAQRESLDAVKARRTAASRAALAEISAGLREQAVSLLKRRGRLDTKAVSDSLGWSMSSTRKRLNAAADAHLLKRVGSGNWRFWEAL